MISKLKSEIMANLERFTEILRVTSRTKRLRITDTNIDL